MNATTNPEQTNKPNNVGPAVLSGPGAYNALPNNTAPSSAPLPPDPPKTQTPKAIDIWSIPFPKTLAELAALDATREVPYLKALCNRRFINTPGSNPTPAQIIPIIQQKLAAHRAADLKHLTPTCDLYLEWKLILQDREEFLIQLQSLLPALPVAQPSKPASSRHLPVAPSQPQLPSPSSENPYINNPALAFACLKDQPAITDPQSQMPHETSGHSNKTNPARPKTHAIPTNQNHNPKTLGHSNNSTPKISPACNPHQLPITNSQLPIPNSPSANCLSANSSSASSAVPPTQSQMPVSTRPRRVHPILSRLTHDQKQQLIHLYEQHSAKDAARIASEKLNLPITTGTLSRLYASWQIAEDNDTRADLEAQTQTHIETLTEQQLQLRLLQLASRPGMDHTELRAVCQSFARLQSVKLSARRVQLAEAKEARLAQNNEPIRDFSPEETQRGIQAMLGKQPDEEDYNPHYNQWQQVEDESTKVGPAVLSGPCAYTELSNNTPAPSASSAPEPSDPQSPNENSPLLTDQCSTTPPPNSPFPSIPSTSPASTTTLVATPAAFDNIPLEVGHS